MIPKGYQETGLNKALNGFGRLNREEIQNNSNIDKPYTSTKKTKFRYVRKKYFFKVNLKFCPTTVPCYV